MRRYFIGGIILLIVLAVVYIFFATRTGTEQAPETPTVARSLSYEREYGEGVHTITGTVSVTDRCEAVTATSTLTDTGIIRLDVSVTPSEGVCLELPGEETFELEVEAPEESTVEAYLNGSLVTL